MIRPRGDPEAVPACPVCLGGGPREFRRFPTCRFLRCQTCGLIFAPDLRPMRGDGLAREAVVSALQPLRERNFRRILDHLCLRLPRGARLLEVGSSTGVFLDLASRRGFDVFGIEPDPFFAEISARRFPTLADRVTHGFFPDARPAGTFDVICFNDVFEHIPDAPSVMTRSRDLLTDGGCISLSIPTSEGFYFNLATLAHRFGSRYLLVRMLQLEYPFPHLYYFASRSMKALALRSGMRVEHVGALEILTADSIAARFAMDQASPGLNGFRAALAQGLFRVQQALPPRWAKPDLLHFVLSSRA